MQEAQHPAVAWAVGQGAALVGEPVLLKDRPWGLTWRLPTASGPLWLKELGAGCRYEPDLVRLLADAGLLAPPLATAPGRLLLPHLGEPMRDLPQEQQQAVWEQVLPAYAELQRSATALVPALVEAGVPDASPHRLPHQLARLLAQPGLAADVAPQAHAAAGAFAAWCAELESRGPAPTVQHDDLHDGNVVVAGGDAHVVDWGDAAVAHPFSTLLVLRRTAAERGGADPVRLRDAYLEAWPGDRRALRETAELAERVGRVGRALSWERALAGSPAAAAEWGNPVAAWLSELAPAA